MRRLVHAVLLLLLLGVVAEAQERASPGIPVRRGKNDGLRMVPRERPKEQGEDSKEEPAEKARPKDPFEAALTRLATWPSTAAREAAAALSIHGPEIEARLIAVLPSAEPPLAAGICLVLGDVGGDASLAAVQRVAARPSMSGHLSVIFETLGKLDGVSAVRRVLPFLRHPKRHAREAAEIWLRDRLNASFADRLEGFLAEPYRGARLSALRLLERVASSRARARAFDLLGDEAPEVAGAAAEILAAHPDPETILGLNGEVAAAPPRKMAYAILALILIEGQTGERAFSADTIPHLLGRRGLRSYEKAARGAAAVALADIGFDSDVPEVDAVLDREVVLTLLDTVGGKKFFVDYNTFAELARDRFGKLTGVIGRRPIPKLWQWWAENQEGFVARRALRSIRPDALDALRVRARSLVEPALPGVLFSTVAEDAGGPDVLGIDFVYLMPETARHLASVISSRLFDMPDSGAVDIGALFGPGSERGGTIGPDVIISVSVEKRTRTALVQGGEVPPSLVAVLKELRAIRQAYSWQRFWDRDTYPRYGEFIRAESEFFAGDPTRKEKDARLKNLILTSLDDLTTDTERVEAVTMLGGLTVPLTDSEAYRLALVLEAEADLDPFTERVVKILAASRKPLVLPILAGWFERRPGEHGLDLFVGVLSGLGEKVIAKAAVSDRTYLRRAALRAAARTLEGEALVAMLDKGIRDEFPSVRREALLNVGRAGIEGSLRTLLTGLEDEDEEVRGAAIEGMGLLARPEVVPVLAREVKSEDLTRRLEAIRALCATGIEEALAPVLVALTEDESTLVRGVVSREIVSFGVLALGGLTGIVTDRTRKPSVRAHALDSLVRIGKDHVTDVLIALLEDPDEDVADAAAYGLASRASPAAVPRLLLALEKGRNLVFTVAALEQVSGQTFPTAQRGELPVIYRGWWNESRNTSAWEWFVSSLGARGHPVAGFAEMDPENLDPKVVPTLIGALASGDWFVRANANLWLQRATLEGFGEASRFTMEEDLRDLQKRWRDWWESR